MFDFGELWIWERYRDKLSWYYNVALNRMPAKYLICNRIACDLPGFDGIDDKDLWMEHGRLAKEFDDAWHAIRRGEMGLGDMEGGSPSFLDLKAELVKRILRACRFCEWACKVDRIDGSKVGACRLGAESRVSTYFHHLGEELIFRGSMGSGTIFFTSCNMRCAFCQNSDISRELRAGIPIGPRELACMVWQLRMEGCHNANLVGGEPTPHLHTVIEAISMLPGFRPDGDLIEYIERVKADGSMPMDPGNALYEGELNVPILWNSNFYMSMEAMRLLREIVDIWLPDFKYGNDRCALFLSKTPRYFDTVSRNHGLVYEWGGDMVIRHLVMPNHVECCTRPVLEWISKHIPGTPVNVMDQYHPDYACDPYSPSYEERYRSMARRPSREELRRAYGYARELGIDFEFITFEKAWRILPF